MNDADGFGRQKYARMVPDFQAKIIWFRRVLGYLEIT